MARPISINDRQIGPDQPVYIIAEMSANHGQDFNQAVRILNAAKESGADAIKLQTYTPDTLTIQCDKEYFRVGKGSLWEGQTLYELYSEAYTPWEWQPKLKEVADDIGLDLFSTPFDPTAVNFLEDMEVPAYKIASFEVVDLPLIEHVARTNKPIIMSTGMATLAEIDDSVRAIRAAGNEQIALLKCTSAYPAPANEMNLKSLVKLAEVFNVPTGLSDHTLGITIPIVAVSLGACIIEKHFTLSREQQGPDSAFSIEPNEFKAMVLAVRETEQALGEVQFKITEHEVANRKFRRSLFVVKDIKAGELFTSSNIQSIRPADGLAPKYLADILNRHAAREIQRGEPLSWELVG